MKTSCRLLLILTIAALSAWAAAPRLISVEPSGGHNGDELVAKGENLDSTSVAKLFLTAGGKDILVEMKEQTTEAIKFTIPNDLKPGYYNLMFQTASSPPALLEQPISCQVLAADEELIEEEEPELEIIEQEPPEQEEAEAKK